MLEGKIVAGSLPWVVPTDDDGVMIAVNEAQAAGLQAAGSAAHDEHVQGTVRLGLRTENALLVSTLLQMGWDETDCGVEWWVELPDGHRMSRDYTACKAYADAFRRKMREMLPDVGLFEVLAQSTTY